MSGYMNKHSTPMHATRHVRHRNQLQSTGVPEAEQNTPANPQLPEIVGDAIDAERSLTESQLSRKEGALIHTQYRMDLDREIAMLLDTDSQELDEYFEVQAKDRKLRRNLAGGMQCVSLIAEHLLSHPFIVLRRQCQVYSVSHHYHLHPFQLLPIMLQLHGCQGMCSMWKGLSSSLLVQGMSMTLEDAVSKATGWPKQIDRRTSFKSFGQHLLLKCISLGVAAPFQAATLVETVQSNIASDKPGLLDVFREGGMRLIHWSSPQKGRMLPAWALIGPSVTMGISKYLFGLIIGGISSRILRRRQLEQRGDNMLESRHNEIYAGWVALLTTEVVFYPLQTILHRLQLQGTRTIVDNLDNGYAVVPILTSYKDVLDCYRITVQTEGIAGLYKGFGALILQFAGHLTVIQLTKWLVLHINDFISKRQPGRLVPYKNQERGQQYFEATMSHSLSSSDILALEQNVSD